MLYYQKVYFCVVLNNEQVKLTYNTEVLVLILTHNTDPKPFVDEIRISHENPEKSQTLLSDESLCPDRVMTTKKADQLPECLKRTTDREIVKAEVVQQQERSTKLMYRPDWIPVNRKDCMRLLRSVKGEIDSLTEKQIQTIQWINMRRMIRKLVRDGADVIEPVNEGASRQAEAPTLLHQSESDEVIGL